MSQLSKGSETHEETISADAHVKFMKDNLDFKRSREYHLDIIKHHLALIAPITHEESVPISLILTGRA